MKPAHYVLVVLLVLPFVAPKLAWWLIGAMLVATLLLLVFGGTVRFANLFLPRTPKR
jgi:polyferredoxin